DTCQEREFDANHLFDVSLTINNIQYNVKFPLLHIVARNGHLEIIKHLIEKGANVDRKAINGFTPLHLAAMYGHKEVITTLLGKGANVNEKTADGWTPLCLAALTGHKDVVTTLLEKRANPLVRNKDGETPRNLANDENIIQLLKDAETKQIISKAIKTGATLSIITALTVGIGCGIAGVELSILAIAVAAALVTGIIAGGITYSVSRPNDKLDKPDLEVTNQQVSEKTC
ncbi:MAG: ankyrin repeat domain-containing protein, partial [Wolbachia sp.]